MRVGITGALGFIGQETVKALLERGHRVVAVDFPDRIKKYEQSRLPIMSQVYSTISRCVDLRSPWDFLKEVHDVDVVVHAGAVVDTTDMWSESLQALNIDYTRKLSEACSKNRIGMVFISSAAVYGMNGVPNNPYGLSKALGEKIVGDVLPNSISLRLFNVFGKNEHHKGTMASVAWQIHQALLRNYRFEVFNPEAKRDFVPVNVVARCICESAELLYKERDVGRPANLARVHDVGTGQPISFRELVTLLHTVRGVREEDSLISWGDMPEKYQGRYQFFTRAGNVAEITNLGEGTDLKFEIERMWKDAE